MLQSVAIIGGTAAIKAIGSKKTVKTERIFAITICAAVTGKLSRYDGFSPCPSFATVATTTPGITTAKKIDVRVIRFSKQAI